MVVGRKRWNEGVVLVRVEEVSDHDASLEGEIHRSPSQSSFQVLVSLVFVNDNQGSWSPWVLVKFCQGGKARSRSTPKAPPGQGAV